MKKQYKTLFISDIHLGSPGSKAELLNDFLKYHNAEKIYLIGDIIDGWRLKARNYWPQAHTNLIRKFLSMNKKGTELVYIAGNHDDFLREYINDEVFISFGNISFKNWDVHYRTNGQKMLIIHGDQYDAVIKYSRVLGYIGDHAYNLLIFLNNHLNKFRKFFKLKYWSLSQYLKQQTKKAIQFISEYEKVITYECKSKGYSGIVCGHIHTPAIKRINGLDYYNCGDWVESCTLLAEDYEGNIELIYWQNKKEEME